MTRPIIGITTDYDDRLIEYASPFAYAAAVEKAGGLPLLLPYRVNRSLIGQYVDLLDGIIFAGGDDLDPRRWGDQKHPQASPIDPEREEFELALMAEVEKRRMPTLGICLGVQLMNVHRGGSLHQFLPDVQRAAAIEHRKIGGQASQGGEGLNRHPVMLQADSLLARTIGKTEIIVNTSHKQAIDRLGQGLRVVARAPDGVIEGVEDPTMPLWLGVQWHPERQHELAEHLAIFRLLVEKARQTG